MNSEELKNLQAPLKEKYREQPESATFTLKAYGNLGDGITCKVETSRALVEAGLHKATGGTGMLACSGDMLLEALVACAGVTLQAVSVAIGMNIRSGTVLAEGDLDFRGTLGVSKEVPVYQTLYKISPCNHHNYKGILFSLVNYRFEISNLDLV